MEVWLERMMSRLSKRRENSEERGLVCHVGH